MASRTGSTARSVSRDSGPVGSRAERSPRAGGAETRRGAEDSGGRPAEKPEADAAHQIRGDRAQEGQAVAPRQVEDEAAAPAPDGGADAGADRDHAEDGAEMPSLVKSLPSRGTSVQISSASGPPGLAARRPPDGPRGRPRRSRT